MSTGKIIGIVAAVVLVFMAIIGVCVYESSSDDAPAAPVTAVTMPERIATLEQTISDLTRQLQTVKQDNAQLQTQLSAAMGEIGKLERELEILKRSQR